MAKRNISTCGILLFFLLLLSGEAQSQLTGIRHHDPGYLEKSRAIDFGDTASRLELARWCRGQSLFREMIREVDLILGEKPEDPEARALLWQERQGDGWDCSLPPPAVAALPRPDGAGTARRRAALLNEGRTRKFKLAQKAFRFQYWTDIDRERCSRFAKLMNRYYDRLKGFFQITKTKIGINVLIFSKRSDYLAYYSSRAGRSGEHTGGFFLFSESLLCFYDDPYDSTVLTVAKHECTHLLLRHCLKGDDCAIWLDEGLACYFAADGPECAGSYAADCLFTVREDIRKQRAIPLEKLMTLPNDRFRFREYATAWSWICFLHNDPEMKGKLGKLFRRLRQEAAAKQDDDEDRDRELEETTNKLFQEIFGSPAQLQERWASFVEKDLLPQDPERCLELARCCLKEAGKRSEKAPDRRSHLEQGELWLRKARESAGGDLVAVCRLEEARSLLARARCLNYDARETVVAVAEAVRIIDAILTVPANAHLASDAGNLAYSALLAIWNSGDFEEEEDRTACDFHGMLVKAESGETDAAALALIRLQKEAVSALVSLARYAFALALTHDPAHEPAIKMWLHLALDFSPAELEAVFPHVLFLVEEDPGDIRMAALAAAYAGMGKHDHAETLLKRAQHVSVDAEAVARFGRYVEKADAKK